MPLRFLARFSAYLTLVAHSTSGFTFPGANSLWLHRRLAQKTGQSFAIPKSLQCHCSAAIHRLQPFLPTGATSSSQVFIVLQYTCAA